MKKRTLQQAFRVTALTSAGLLALSAPFNLQARAGAGVRDERQGRNDDQKGRRDDDDARRHRDSDEYVSSDRDREIIIVETHPRRSRRTAISRWAD
jgi:hypothetical protein